MDLATNIQLVRERMRAACERAGRSPDSVALLAIAKTHSAEAVQAAAASGLTLFGENKVQEARAKIPLCPGTLRWHLVGHLQTNKVREAVELFEMIQSVDSLRLAEEVNKRAEQAARRMPVLLEVNVAGEPSKFGYTAARLLTELKELNALPRLEIHGLMTVPPLSPVADSVRPSFRRLRELKQQCEALLGAPLPHLSMGMTSDFEVAIEEGATIVRIGTAIFGDRSYARTVAA